MFAAFCVEYIVSVYNNIKNTPIIGVLVPDVTTIIYCIGLVASIPMAMNVVERRALNRYVPETMAALLGAVGYLTVVWPGILEELKIGALAMPSISKAMMRILGQIDYVMHQLFDPLLDQINALAKYALAALISELAGIAILKFVAVPTIAGIPITNVTPLATILGPLIMLLILMLTTGFAMSAAATMVLVVIISLIFIVLMIVGLVLYKVLIYVFQSATAYIFALFGRRKGLFTGLMIGRIIAHPVAWTVVFICLVFLVLIVNGIMGYLLVTYFGFLIPSWLGSLASAFGLPFAIMFGASVLATITAALLGMYTFIVLFIYDKFRNFLGSLLGVRIPSLGFALIFLASAIGAFMSINIVSYIIAAILVGTALTLCTPLIRGLPTRFRLFRTTVASIIMVAVIALLPSVIGCMVNPMCTPVHSETTITTVPVNGTLVSEVGGKTTFMGMTFYIEPQTVTGVSNVTRVYTDASLSNVLTSFGMTIKTLNPQLGQSIIDSTETMCKYATQYVGAPGKPLEHITYMTVSR